MASGHTHGVQAIAFSHDGRRLATAGEDAYLVIWEVGNGVEKELLSHHRHRNVVRVAFSPDGRALASGHSDGEVVLWDLTNGRERTTLTGHMDGLGDLDFCPDAGLSRPEATIELFDSGMLRREKSRRPWSVLRTSSALSGSLQMDELWLPAAQWGS